MLRIFPRLEVEKVLGDGVTMQGVEDERRAAENGWPGCFLAECERDF